MKIKAVFQRPPGSHFGRLWAPNERFRIENESKIDPKWAQNGSKKGVRLGVWFWTPFWTHFHWFLSCFLMIFRCCFGSSHHVNEKCECSESPNFYNRFLRFYCSDEVRKSLKNIWKTMLTCTWWRRSKSTKKITSKRLQNGSKIN